MAWVGPNVNIDSRGPIRCQLNLLVNWLLNPYCAINYNFESITVDEKIDLVERKDSAHHVIYFSHASPCDQWRI